MSLKSDAIFHARVARLVAAGYTEKDANSVAFQCAENPALTVEIVTRYKRGESIDRLRRTTPYVSRIVRMILIGEGVVLRAPSEAVARNAAIKDSYDDDDFEAMLLGVPRQELDRARARG